MADYEGVLADLKARRAALDRERSELDPVIAGLERLVTAASNGRPSQQTPTVPPRAFAGLTMPQAVTKCLKLAQQPQSKRQIQDALMAGGVKAGKSFGAHVYNTLHRLSGPDGPFRREPDGRWSLREWPAAVSEPGNSNAATTH